MNGLTAWLISALLSIGMLVHAYALRRYAKSWILPACIYSLFWFLFTFIPLLVAPYAPQNPIAVLYIFGSCLAFSLGAFVVNWRTAFISNDRNAHPSNIYDTPFLRAAFLICSAVAVVSLLISIALQGISVSDLSTDFFATSNSVIADRYNGELINTIFSEISNLASYLSVCLGGLLYRGYKGRLAKFYVILISMVPSLVVMAVLGAKGMIFLCIALFYGGVMVRRVRAGDRRIVDKKSLLNGALALVILIPLITVSFLARGLYTLNDSQAVIDGLLRYYVSYSSAHLYAFSDWFSWYTGAPSLLHYPMENTTGGFYTFMPIFQLLGDDRYVAPGVYTEYFSYGPYLGSNIYTFFRGLIIDFTIPGSLVFLAFVGLISHLSFASILRNPYASASISFFVVLVGYIYTSFIISLLVWNSPYALFFALWALIGFNNAHNRSRKRVGSPFVIGVREVRR